MIEDPPIPPFLKRNQQGELPVTQATEQTPAAATTKRRKMKDAYVATIKVTIPLDMMEPTSFAKAAEAVKSLGSGLPAGSTFETEARIGKVEA